MSLLKLTVQPYADVTHHTSREVFDERAWDLHWYTNTVHGGWSLDLIADTGAAIRGIPVPGGRPGLDLLAHYRNLDIPSGVIFVQGATDSDPGLTDFADGAAQAYYYAEDAA